jgi:hypothetical protein
MAEPDGIREGHAVFAVFAVATDRAMARFPGDGASDQIRSSRASDTGRSAHAADAVRETPTEVVCGKKIK